MSILTRSVSHAALLAAAALALVAGMGMAAAPAAADDQWLTRQQVDRNGDGTLSASERRWAESLGFEETNAGPWQYTGRYGSRDNYDSQSAGAHGEWMTRQQVDRNGDGTLSASERRRAESLGYEETNAGPWQYTERYGSSSRGNYNNDGYYRGQRVWPASYFDRNGDGTLSKKERRRAEKEGFVQTNSGQWVQPSAYNNPYGGNQQPWYYNTNGGRGKD